MFRLTIAVVLVAEASALRKHRQQKSPSMTPMIDGLFTFGAPGVGVPAIKNPRTSSGCFPGARAWTSTREGFPWFNKAVDLVVPLAQTVGYRHPWMEGAEIDVNDRVVNFMSCNEELTGYPSGRGRTWLHEGEVYREGVQVMNNDLVLNMTILGTRFSYDRNPTEEVAAGVREFGWRLVGSGFDDGTGAVRGGAHVSHLFQQPETLDCMITFQGSQDLADWFANLDSIRSNFCGLPEKVHRGFRDHMRRMVRQPTWQEGVRQHLGKCASVFVTGHSLGGAQASLFAACVAQAPSSGSGYDDDYSYISWLRETPARLPYK